MLITAIVAAGLQAGTYYTWASGVMPGLARVDDRTSWHAMQQMNIAIVNPVFLAHLPRRPHWGWRRLGRAGSRPAPG